MTPCQPYSGTIRTDGYGYSSAPVNGERMAHRIAYIATKGPIPDGLVLDHLCRNRACCNPEHLEPVTVAENNRRGWEWRDRSRCRRGHEFTPENTKVGSDGYRTCRTCYRDRDRESKARMREQARAFREAQA